MLARNRRPERDNAFRLWIESGKKRELKDIAAELGVADSQVRKWKKEDNWEDKSKGTQPFNEPFQKTHKKIRGGQCGNKNAVGHGAPIGNRNNLKHGIYSKILYSSLSDEEKNLLSINELNEKEELKFIINLCDIQIIRFMRMITETLEKGNLIVKSVSNSSTKDKDGKTVGNITTTNTMNTNELIIRYNSEIEKIKKQKIKCIESLLKTENTFKGTDCN